ncbi:hypothetical protein [Nocardioides sp. B-3]|uniref:hypothetical protein n=1 Tax=Nocardioides sp. B-3 TaxID=2895565 RepID=UPI0021524B5F|nr:hypothetical protein [Nocardioides sp. B-3]UUZ59891.1 hypothetical protein LP418_02255 [Nocardioides sp. B-3]
MATLIAISLTSWGPPTTPVGELTRDRYALLIAAVAGGLAALLIAWAFTADKRLLVAAAVLGLAPAFIKTTAIFTGAY